MFFKKKEKSIEEKIKKFKKIRSLNNDDKLCYAPFVSLLINQSGEVFVCHYNRGFIAGKYPQQSLLEIWNSEILQSFRNSISNNKLLSSCYICIEKLEKEQFSTVPILKYDYIGKELTNYKYPSLIDLQISNKCNCQCIMCSGEYSSLIRKNREKKPPYPEIFDENFYNEINLLLPFLKAISFTGGEPLIIEHYYHIWENIILNNPELRINISTNATYIPKKFKELIEKGKFNFTISIDTMSEQLYEKIRINASFAKTLENALYLLDYSKRKKTYYSIKSCIMTINYSEYPTLFNFWNEKEIPLNPKLVVYPPVLSLKYASKEKIEDAMNILKSNKPKAHSYIQKINSKIYLDLINQLEIWLKESDLYDINDLYKNKEIDKIEKLLINKLQKIENNEYIIDKLKRILSTLKISFNNDELYRVILINLLCISEQMLCNELKRDSEEKILERIKQIIDTNF